MGNNEGSATKDYPKNGYYLKARKITHGKLVTYPAAYTLFDILIGWANFSHGKKPIRHFGKLATLKPGQLPISARDLARRLSWSVNTVYDALEYLEAEGCIKRSIAFDGTVVTIPKYHVYQNKLSYNRPLNENADQKPIPQEGEADQKLIHQRIKKRSTSCLGGGSETDHTGIRSNTDPQFSAIQTYLASLRPKKRREEEEAHFSELLEDFLLAEVTSCFVYVQKNGVLLTKEPCKRPMAYLAKAIPDVLPLANRSVRPAPTPIVHEASRAEQSLAEMERELEELQKTVAPHLVAAFRRRVEAKRLQEGEER